MSNPYAFEFSDGSKKYTLVCTVESPGVQPRFTLALTHGSSSWTSDSVEGRPEDASALWENECSAALLGSSGNVFRVSHDTPPKLFLDREGQRQAIKLQPCTGRASAAEAYAFQHSLALTRTVARQQDALLAKEKQVYALELELRKVEAQLARDVEDRTKKDEKLIASLMELLNSKKEELQRLADQLKDVQLAPADEQEEDPATDDEEGYGSERGSQQRAASSDGGVRSAVTANPESAGGSAAGASGVPADANEAHMEAATQDLEERHLMDEDMLDTPPLDRIEEAPARADDRMSDAPAAPEEPATEAVLPSDPPPNRPKALAKRRRRPA